MRQEPPPSVAPSVAQSPPPPPIPDDILAIPPDEPLSADEPVLTKPLDLPEDAQFDQPDMDITGGFTSADAPFYADDDAADSDRIDRIATLAPAVWPEPETIILPKTFLLFLACLVFGNGLLGLYCFSHPERTEAVLARLPLLSSLVAGERFSAQHIVLSDLEGRYQTTKDNQKVFTVFGTATNSAALPARTIQLEGAIYDEKGKMVSQRLIFCGTNITPDRLTNLTLREIGALQDLVPPKQFHVTTGEAVKFLIVFMTPPATVAEFSSRVVAAQFGSL
jgi:hypothetical protein